MDSYKISALSSEDLDMFLTRRYINDATKQKLNRLIDFRSQIAQIALKLKTLDDEEKAISADQARLRENIEALTKTPEAKQLINRYIAKANEQESRIEAINKERQALKIVREQIENELAIAIKDFDL